MDLVSFLVPVYNVENYLGKCLDCLLAQTYPNIEIILVNDGSKDHSLAIAKDYQKKHSNIHIYSYPNSGISKTRNRLLKHASGEFVMFVDSDDYIDPDTVTVMMETLKSMISIWFNADFAWIINILLCIGRQAEEESWKRCRRCMRYPMEGI